MSYTSVFGGSTLYPSDVSYVPIVLGNSVVLEWPLENAGGTPAARIIDVRAGSSSRSLTFPDATLAAPGQTILVNSLSSSTQTFTVLDAAGNTLASISPGTQWQFYLADVATAAGTWRVFQFGASSTTVQASALAGYGLVASGAQLSQAMAITTFTTTPRTLLVSDRAAMLTWTGTGAGQINLPAAATAGSGFFVSVRNSGGGALTIDPSGAELIDGASVLVLQPGESASIGTQGTTWYSLGFGQSAVFAFDYLDIDLAGQSGSITLTGAQLNRTAYRFHGALAGDVQIIVPPTIQQYWVDNSTSGAFVLTLNTATGTPAATTVQGQRNIFYCDGTKVVTATTAAVAGTVPATQGGTGQTSYTAGDLLVASSSVGLTKLPAVASGAALISAGVGALPVWGDIDLTASVTGALPIANGGTGAITAFSARTALGAAASGANTDITSLAGLTTALSIAQGGTGAITAPLARVALGAAASGANTDITSLTALTSVGIGTGSPAALLHVSGSATTATARIANSGNGAGTFDGSGAGLDLLANGMSVPSLKYAPAIKFGSTDVDFTTTNPKYGAAITAEAAETYSADTNGGMLLTFWTAPTGPHATSSLTVRAQITAAGDFNMLGGGINLSSTGSALVNGSGGIGYGTGSGGAVAQLVSRTTGVTLNKTNGTITLFSAAGLTTWQSFTVTNSTVAATDNVRVCQQSGTDLYQIHVTAVAAGSFRVSFATTGGVTVEAPVFNFAVIKAVAA